MERQEKKAPNLQHSTAHATKAGGSSASAVAFTVPNKVFSEEALSDLAFQLQQSELSGDPSQDICQQLVGILKSAGAVDSKLLGVVGKCSVPGCDVHSLTLDNEIIEHYRPDQILAEQFQKARAHLNEGPDSVVAVMVFENHFEEIHLDGSSRKMSI